MRRGWLEGEIGAGEANVRAFLCCRVKCQPEASNLNEPIHPRDHPITNSLSLQPSISHHNHISILPSSNSPRCPTVKSSSLTRISPRKLTNKSLKQNSWHKYAAEHLILKLEAYSAQKNVQGAIEKLTALEKQTRQVSIHQ